MESSSTYKDPDCTLLKNMNQAIDSSKRSIRVALFASGPIGIEIAKFLIDIKNPPECLIVDTKDSAENRQILTSLLPKESRVIESTNLYEESTLNYLKELELDLSILAWWPYILKSPVISIPKLGTLNFHPSLLPYNRGKHYNFWTIVEETPFGVTLHWINEGVDTGDIAFQREILKTWEDTGETLYNKAQNEIVSLFKDNWSNILDKKIPRKKQPIDAGSYHHSRELQAASEIKLDKTYTGREILNIMRARTFPPHPGAWFLDENGKRYQMRINIEQIEEN